MLDSRQLTAIQAAAATTLDLSCTTTRNTAAAGGVDAWGHPTETWTQVYAGACAMSEPTGAQLQKYAELIGSARSWKLSFPFGTDVKRDDRVSVLGQTLRVQVDLSVGSYSTLSQVLATQINEEIH